MRTADDLAGMSVTDMFNEIEKGIGRELGLAERLQLSMLSGTYRGGQGVVYHDLVHAPVEVRLPDYLKALGYPLDEKARVEGERP